MVSGRLMVIMIQYHTVQSCNVAHYRFFLLDDNYVGSAGPGRGLANESSSPDADYHHYSPYNHSTSFLHASSSKQQLHYCDDAFRRRYLSEFSLGKTLHFSVVPQFLSPPLLIHRRYPPLGRFLFYDAARLI